MSSKGRVNLPKGLSPKLVRESHVARSNHLRANGPIFMAYTMDRYLAATVEGQESFRGHSRVTLNALDELAAKDKVKAARRLFNNPAASSAQHAAVGSPTREKKKKKSEPAGWSPDGELSPTNAGRDGHRPKVRVHVGFTPPKGKKAKLVD